MSNATASKPRLRFTSDGLMNVYTGMGTANSKSGNNFWGLSPFLSGNTIDVIYRESWLAQAICSIPAEDATRQWRRFTGEYAEDVHRVERALHLKTITQEAATLANAYGGAAILMVTNQPLDKPLDVKKIKQGDLKKLLVFDRYDLSAQQMNMLDPLADNYMLPDYYTLSSGSQRIHWTHVARFSGVKLPRRLAMMEQGWGDSLLRKSLTEINNTVASFHGIAELMQQANVDTITREGLGSDLTTSEEMAIVQRYQLFNMMKSNYGLALLDSSETLNRLTLNLSGVSQVQEQLITWISGAAQIPVSRLFGSSAKGMNATGEGDEDVYYDRVKSLQERLSSPLAMIDRVMVRSALGDYPQDTDFLWEPLSQLDDEERADMEYADSQTDRSYYDMGVLKRSVIARKLQQRDQYEITDEQITELEEMEAVGEGDFGDDLMGDGDGAQY